MTNTFACGPLTTSSASGPWKDTRTGSGPWRSTPTARSARAGARTTACASGTFAASGGEDWSVRLWTVENGACVHVLRAHTNWVRAVAFSPDGSTLASSSEDESVRFWNVQDGAQLGSLPSGQRRVYSTAFSPNGGL